ncbi:MAG TPA: hypothetical protein VGE26_07325, partial [Sphingobacteriaceae bacterium]
LTFDTGWKTTNNGSAEFVASLSGLEPGTTYYYRAYAYNGYKYGYGDRLSFSTPAVPPTVGEVTISDMQSTRVKATAELTHGGGSPVTARGFVWTSQAADPTIISNEGFTDDMSGEVGSFTHDIMPLEEGKVYRIRAYARNGVDFAYGPVEIFTICPPTITRYHVAGHNGAPATKEVTYNVMSSSASGEMKCWITQNLGAKDAAITATDVNPEAVGWFWQFNRVQGYQRNGSGRIPNSTWPVTTQNGNWDPENDPCKLLLGADWRLPTKAEWENALGGFNSLASAYSTDLKLNAAGYLNSAGVHTAPSEGLFWSSTQNTASEGYALYLRGNALASSLTKLDGFSVRCLIEGVTETLPSVSKVVASGITETSISGSAAVTLDGGSDITARGYVWNTTGGNPEVDPVTRVPVAVGTGTGEFSVSLTGLDKKRTYYIWAYATNSTGTAYSEVEKFGLCAPSITRYHYAGHNGAPVTKTVTYKIVRSDISGEHKCWIGQNLGAKDAPVSVTDPNIDAYGWYWQFNGNQGYERSGTSRKPDTAWPKTYEVGNWNPAKDPCKLLLGEGWRMPTKSEWETVRTNFTNLTGAYNTTLNLHATGYLSDVGTHMAANEGLYWSSNGDTDKGYALYLRSSVSQPALTKLDGFGVRCLLDEAQETLPSVSKVVLSSFTETSTTGSSAVTLDGGSGITARGFVWNTTGGDPEVDPVTNVPVMVGAGTGEFQLNLTGLESGKTYYVWAYATNSTGTAYSEVEKFVVCPPSVTGYHVGGHNGAPSDRTIEYGVTGSMLSGTSSCWITRNLGATQQAGTLNDPSDAAAGWYWQFNKTQGYEVVSAKKNPTSWGGNNSENSDWKPENDPCNLLLGGGWRLPTRSEWVSVIGDYPTPALAFQSDLRLHYAGYLDYGGTFRDRSATSSVGGYFWSNNQAASYSSAATMTLVPNVTKIMEYTKADGFNVRCVLTETQIGLPSVSEVKVSDMTSIDFKVTAVITTTGGSPVTDRGFVWNDTGIAPVVDQDQTLRPGSRSGSGSFEARLAGLEEYKTYYIWAFAKNEHSGIALSKLATIKFCPPVTRRHVEGFNGAARSVTITYDLAHSNLSGESACWITRNLGAVNPPSGPNDATAEAAGWYWQFGNKQGYEYTATRYPVQGWTNPLDLNSSLTAINDPCVLLLGGGWRLPASTEYSKVAVNWPTLQHAYNSELKIHAGGALDGSTGVLEANSRGINAAFWSSTSSATRYAWDIRINSTPAVVMSIPKSYGLPVRCILTTPEITAPAVSEVKLSGFTSTSVNVASDAIFDGGSPIESRGIVWNNTGDPKLENKTGSVVHSVAASGPFSLGVTGLTEGIYHMRAYATNGNGVTGYGPVETFRICVPSISVNHVAGVSGAPESKTLTYNLVGTNLNGQLNCWITKNLGADVEATSYVDPTTAAAGWYWQFNRLQGYAFNGARTPTAPWMSSVSETAHWAANVDPCRVMLGGTWRLPTAAEWTAANTLWNSSRGSQPALEFAYDSGLKLHAAGWLNGVGVTERGTQARYWSSNRAGEGFYVSYTESWALHASTTTSSVSTLSRVIGTPVRCIQ